MFRFLSLLAFLFAATASANPTTTVGLTIVVGFPDDPAQSGDQSFLPRVEAGGTSVSYVDKLCNEVGFSQGGNIGSVRDYFLYQSGGLYDFTNVVAPEVMLPHPWSYYDAIDDPFDPVAAGRQVARDAIDALAATGYTIPANVTRDASGRLTATSIFYAGNSSMIRAFATSFNPGHPYGSSTDTIGSYQISHFFAREGAGRQTAQSGNGIFIHECGHLLFGWPDLYDTDGSSRGIDDFCLMAVGGNLGRLKTPAPVNAYYRIREGWANVVDISPDTNLTATLPSTGNVVYRITNPTTPAEHFLIENYGLGNPYTVGIPDRGIVIWHVDGLKYSRGNTQEDRTFDRHYLVSLEQADGLFNLETRPGGGTSQGDSTDLHDAATPFFNDDTTPNSRWWDPTNPSGVSITVLSPPGAQMKVRFGNQLPATDVAKSSSGDNLITYEGIANHSYTLQVSTDLTTWTPLATPTANAQGLITYTHASPPTGKAFYQLSRSNN